MRNAFISMVRTLACCFVGHLSEGVNNLNLLSILEPEYPA